MSNGYRKMPCGWLDMPALGESREPYCKRAAWAWLIEAARWSDGSVNILGKTVDLRRGQLSHSLRYLAKAWGWEEPAVRRFLKRLQRDEEIENCSDAGQNVITICNYTEYSFQNDAIAAEVTQERRRSDANKKKDKRIKKKEYPANGSLDLHAPDGAEENAAVQYVSAQVIQIPAASEFEEFWKGYPKKADAKLAQAAYRRARSAGVSRDEIMTGLRSYVWPEYRFTPRAHVWLADQQWVAKAAPVAAPRALELNSSLGGGQLRWVE